MVLSVVLKLQTDLLVGQIYYDLFHSVKKTQRTQFNIITIGKKLLGRSSLLGKARLHPGQVTTLLQDFTERAKNIQTFR